MNIAAFRRALCLMLLVLGNRAPAQTAAQTPMQPALRIETSMHTAVIRRIATDAANRWLVTASDDKTARVWELAADRSSARLVRVLRPPIGAGHEGKLFAVAMSPDGQTIAVGGFTGPDGEDKSIYLFERASGRLVRRLSGLPEVIPHLVFAPDGRYLAATLGTGNGVRVYDTASWQLAGADRDYGADSYGADFDAAGRLVTSCRDGYLRLYARPAGTGLRLLAKVQTTGGKRPASVEFAPTASGESERVAVGFNDTTQVEVYAGRDLQRLFAADTRGVDNGHLGTVAWSWDGATLYAGGGYGAQGEKQIRAWSQGGRGSFRDVAASPNTVMDIIGLRGGGVAYGAGDPAFGVLGADGRRTLFTGPAIADYRYNQEGFLLAEDGAEVQFGYETFGKSPARFKLNGRQLAAASGTAAHLRAPLTEARGLTVSDWKNTYTPKRNGQGLKLKTNEVSYSLALAPDGGRFLLGTNFSLRLFDRNGVEQWWQPVPGVAWSVNINGNGKLAVAAFGDGTIRWYRVTDGQELLAFFPHNDRQRWVLWTPSGYYDCSPGADDLIGWHVNNGPDAAADFFPVGQFRSTYYRPDIIDLILATLDEGKAVEQANLAANRRREELDIARRLPPVVEIVSPADGATVTTSAVTVRFRVRTPSGEPVTGVRALVDGRPPDAARGQGVKPPPDARELAVTIPERDCEIAVLAENRFAVSTAATVRVKWAGRAAPSSVVAGSNTGNSAGADLLKPVLYILAVGVSRYADASRNLGFAAKDARDFTAALTTQKGGLYRDVAVKLLTDEQATRDEVVDGLEWILKQTTSRDVAMVFFAGHGVNDTLNAYYFLPHNADDKRLMRTGVATTEIKKTVESLAGKTLFFIDSCHSGNALGARGKGVDINGLANELAAVESGAIVYTASTGRQVSLEDSRWNNGAFTKALVEGLLGAADLQRNGVITTDTLAAYIANRVKELTGGNQTPTTAKPRTIQDFPIAVKLR
jgi:WD40 repeat protein